MDDFEDMGCDDRFENDLDNWELTQLMLDEHYEENEENLDEWEDGEDEVESDLAQNPWGAEGVV